MMKSPRAGSSVDLTMNNADPSVSTPSSSRRAKKANAATKDGENTVDHSLDDKPPPADDDDASDDAIEDRIARTYEGRDDDDDQDPFGGFGGPGGPPQGLSGTLRALSGMIQGVSQRLREILVNLKQKDDPSVQLIALQELSEILLVSTEDNLSGHFSPDAFVKELVALMQPSEFGEENPEMMLLACRCLANLMEALPASTANVVYGGAVPILCQKLLEIHFIDLAEQALSVSLLKNIYIFWTLF
jgi:E3 ubiquitin-protein ligase TRIP12